MTCTKVMVTFVNVSILVHPEGVVDTFRVEMYGACVSTNFNSIHILENIVEIVALGHRCLSA